MPPEPKPTKKNMANIWDLISLGNISLTIKWAALAPGLAIMKIIVNNIIKFVRLNRSYKNKKECKESNIPTVT